MSSQRSRIIVLGGGFGGVYTILHLAKFLRRQKLNPDITLISNRNYFLFSPLLHEMATGAVGEDNLVYPLRELTSNGVVSHVFQEMVKGINFNKKEVITDNGEVPYDYLVIALGSAACTFDVEGADTYALPLKTLADAANLRNHVIDALEQAAKEKDAATRSEFLSFVVVGGGALGTELVPELAEMFLDWESIYPNLNFKQIKIHLVHDGEMVVEQFGPTFHRQAMRVFKRYSIKTHFKCRVVKVTPNEAILSTGERIAARTVIWSVGIRPVTLKLTPGTVASRGHILVEPTLQLKAFPEVFALGDIATNLDKNGKPLPATAQVAVQQGRAVARNLIALMRGRELTPFHYRHKGFTLSLGQWNAIVQTPVLTTSGLFGWLVYRGVYLFKLVGAANKFRVGVDWFLDMFFPRRSSEL